MGDSAGIFLLILFIVLSIRGVFVWWPRFKHINRKENKRRKLEVTFVVSSLVLFVMLMIYAFVLFSQVL